MVRDNGGSFAHFQGCTISVNTFHLVDYPHLTNEPPVKSIASDERPCLAEDGDLKPRGMQGWATAYFAAGCSVFYAIWKGVEAYDKPSQQPYVRTDPA